MTSLPLSDPPAWSLLVRMLGAAQLGMAALGLVIPRLLHWNAALAPLRPFFRRLFWTYGAYVFGTNLFFGVALALRPDFVLVRTPAGSAIALYLFLFWGVRFGLELAGFDRDAIPETPLTRLGRFALFVPLAALAAGYAALLGRGLW